MALTAKKIKELATKVPISSGSKHECLQKLVVQGFFDTPKITEQIVREIRETTGARWPSNIVQTYMKKFMKAGVVRIIRSERYNGNIWVLASEEEVRAGELALMRELREQASVNPQPENGRIDDNGPLRAIPLGQKTKILFLASNPSDTTRLALDEESRQIEEKLQATKHRDGFEFIWKGAVRPGDLLQHLNQHRPHVIHFSGHGSASEEIFFSDSSGRAIPVSKSAMTQLFNTLKDNVRIVVLNACYSREQARAITDVIDCAIGMRKSVGDQAAIVFAAAFYQALGFGRSLKIAFESGKTAMMLEGIAEQDTPELLMRKGVDASKIFLAGPGASIHEAPREELVS